MLKWNQISLILKTEVFRPIYCGQRFHTNCSTVVRNCIFTKSHLLQTPLQAYISPMPMSYKSSSAIILFFSPGTIKILILSTIWWCYVSLHCKLLETALNTLHCLAISCKSCH